jgi:hypothetical protein
MEQITKEWSKEFLVLVANVELCDTDTIGSPLVTQVEHVRQSSGTKKKKKQEEFQDIKTDDENNASEENGSGSLGGGETKQMDKEEGMKEKSKEKVKLHRLKILQLKQ